MNPVPNAPSRGDPPTQTNGIPDDLSEEFWRWDDLWDLFEQRQDGFDHQMPVARGWSGKTPAISIPGYTHAAK